MNQMKKQIKNQIKHVSLDEHRAVLLGLYLSITEKRELISRLISMNYSRLLWCMIAFMLGLLLGVLI